MTDFSDLGVADPGDLGVASGDLGIAASEGFAMAVSGPSRLSFSPPPPPPDEQDEHLQQAPSSDPWTADDLAAIAAAEAAERQRLSFERSLAGPSVGKAGELPRRKAELTRRPSTESGRYAVYFSLKLTPEINRIIAEASKGSK